VLLHLARRGYAVTGVDNAPEMLARLERKGVPAGSPVTLLQMDMTDFSVAQEFKLALMPFNTFMHLATTEAQLAVLTCTRRHLRPGAVLALDMPNPGEAYAAAAGEQGLVLERTFADGDRVVQQFSTMEVDRAAQLARITWIYDSVGTDGAVQRITVPMTLRYTFPGEMRLLLERSGFALAHLYGDYDRSPFADGSPRMTVLARAV
jgi:SAM-dependent methyltransferase